MMYLHKYKILRRLSTTLLCRQPSRVYMYHEFDFWHFVLIALLQSTRVPKYILLYEWVYS